MMNAYTFLIALLLSTQIEAFGNKAGQCTDDVKGMVGGMGGKDDPSLGWKIVPKSNSYRPDKDLEIQITNDKADAKFEGILLFARAADGNYAGTWKLPSDKLFSTSNIDDVCKKAKKPQGSAVSHTSEEGKKSTTFTWKPTAGGAGPVEFRGLIVAGGKTSWMRFKPANVTGPGTPENIKAASGNSGNGNNSQTVRYDYFVTSLVLVGATILSRFM